MYYVCVPSGALLTAVVVGGAAGVQGPVARSAAGLGQRAARLDAALTAADTEAVLAPRGRQHRRAVRVHGAVYRAAACAHSPHPPARRR